jgi:hypothetical protein
VLFALVYLLLRRVVGWIAGSSDEQMNTEVELVVLRHQLKILKRQVDRPQHRPDRVSGLDSRAAAGTSSGCCGPIQPTTTRADRIEVSDSGRRTRAPVKLGGQTGVPASRRTTCWAD